jgi:hypothetical protein
LTSGCRLRRTRLDRALNGNVGFPGRSGSRPRRAALHAAYTAAQYGPDQQAKILKAARYYVSTALRERLPASQIETMGMRTETPAERQAEIRERQAATLAAATALTSEQKARVCAAVDTGE